VRRFSFRPALTLRGRDFKGPRGWAGKPLHPPLTDVPVGALLPLVLTLTVTALTVLGGTLGGRLAFDYGFNVETAGDSPVWHESETDVFPETSTD
jgi:hypothetical protein